MANLTTGYFSKHASMSTEQNMSKRSAKAIIMQLRLTY